MLFDAATALLVLLALLPRRAVSAGLPPLLRHRWAVLGATVLSGVLAGTGRGAVQLPILLLNVAIFLELVAWLGQDRRPWARWLVYLGIPALWTSALFVVFPVYQPVDTAQFWFVDLFDKAFLWLLMPVMGALGVEAGAGFVLGYFGETLRFLSNNLMALHYVATLFTVSLIYAVVRSRVPELPAPPRFVDRRVPLAFALLPAAAFAAHAAAPGVAAFGIAWKLAAALFAFRGLALLFLLVSRSPALRAVFWAGLVVVVLHPALLWAAGALAVLDGALGMSEAAARGGHAARLSRRFDVLLEGLARAIRPIVVVGVVLPFAVIPDLVGGVSDDEAAAAPAPRPELPEPAPPAPEGMVRVATSDGRPLLVDVYEFPNRAGALPLVGLTGAAASAACARVDKHLCTADEWFEACSAGGVNRYIFPSAAADGAFVPSEILEEVRARLHEACNVGQPNSGRSLLPAGAMAACRSELGLHDMVGNAYEWVAVGVDGGTGAVPGLWGLAGSFFRYDDDQTMSCAFRALVHDSQLPVLERDAIGFRCCR